MHLIHLVDPAYDYDDEILKGLICKNGYDYSANLILCFTQRRCRYIEHKFLQEYVRDGQTVIPPQVITINSYFSIYSPYKIISEFEAKYIMLQTLHEASDVSYQSKMPELVDEIFDLYNLLYFYNPCQDMKDILHNITEKIDKSVKERYFSEIILNRINFLSDIIARYDKVLKERGVATVPDVKMCAEKMPYIENLVIDYVSVLTPMYCEMIKALLEKCRDSNIYCPKISDDSYLEMLLKTLSGIDISINDVRVEEDKRKSKVLIPIEVKENEINSFLPTCENEVRFIGQKIKELALHKMKAEEIVVVFPDPYKYIPMIKRLFENYRIDYNYSFGERILNEPAIQAAYSVIKLVLEDFPRDILLYILRNRYFDIADSKEMIGELRGSSIIYGRENWQSLGGKLGQFVEIVARQFSCETLAEYLSNYENLLMNLNYGRVEDLTEREKGVIESFWELLKSLIWLAKELKVGFNEFSRIMRYLLMQKRYFGEEKLIRGVGIMGMIEAGGVRAKAKFICGLIDGDEPKIKEWVLIPDAVMKIINLPTIEDQVKEQKYYFDLEMQSGAEIIYLTYPQLEGDRKTLCSFFMSDYLMSNKYDCIKVSSEGAYSLEEYLINKGEHRGIKLANYLEGINLSQSSKEYIDKYFDVHAINVGSIAKYYECPQEFYFSDVLLLAGEREPTFDYNAMEWGTTIHRILFQAFAEGERWKQRAYEEFNKASEVYPEGVREFFLKRFKLDIEFLEHIQNVLQEDYVVYERELKLESKLDLDDIVQKVKGVIDRVDIRKDGVGYLLIDYKVGSIEGRKHDLQLPLYAWLYKERSGVLPEKLILLSLNGLKSRIKDLTKKDLIIADALVKAKEIIKKIREGIFYNVEEEDDEVEVDNWKCRHCEFRHLCWQ